MPVLKYFDPTTSSWKVLTAGGGGADIPVQEEAPADPAHGDLWLDTDEVSLAESVGVRGTLVIGASGTDQTGIVSATWTKLTGWVTEEYDDLGAWTSGGDFIIPEDGRYRGTAQFALPFAAAGTTQAIYGIFRNNSTALPDRLAVGSTPLQGTTSPYANFVMPPRSLPAGTVLSVYLYQTTGANMTLAGNIINHFSIEKVS